MNLLQGTRLAGGKYTIDRMLGQGAFGITYLATGHFTVSGALGDMKVDKKVAIKEFFMGDFNTRAEGSSQVDGTNSEISSNYRRKFKKEAENLAKLTHDNIVRVYDVFDENGTTYYVMEFIDGQSLDDFIAMRGHLTEQEAVAITREIGSALEYMHSRKMLHLDLKPRNVMRDHDSHNYLIDFGLSKQYNDGGEPESSTTIGLGTPGYAPLEQAQYKQDGTFPATLDVYALGATMYKMLTGSRPADASELLNEGFPHDKLQHVSPQVRAVVARAMCPMRKERFQSITEMLAALPVDEATQFQSFDNKVTDERTVIQTNNDNTILSGPQSSHKSSEWNNKIPQPQPPTPPQTPATHVHQVPIPPAPPVSAPQVTPPPVAPVAPSADKADIGTMDGFIQSTNIFTPIFVLLGAITLMLLYVFECYYNSFTYSAISILINLGLISGILCSSKRAFITYIIFNALFITGNFISGYIDGVNFDYSSLLFLSIISFILVLLGLILYKNNKSGFNALKKTPLSGKYSLFNNNVSNPGQTGLLVLMCIPICFGILIRFLVMLDFGGTIVSMYKFIMSADLNTPILFLVLAAYLTYFNKRAGLLFLTLFSIIFMIYAKGFDPYIVMKDSCIIFISFYLLSLWGIVLTKWNDKPSAWSQMR